MTHHDTVRVLLRCAGRTYAEDAGITLADTPAPLYRTLVLATLLATRISAGIAVAAAAELVRSGMGTPERMRDAPWQDRVDALGRAHYRRHDESAATALGEGAELMHAEYRDDLRRLRERAEQDPGRIRELLLAFPRIGPTGAEIFCREVQAVWPELRPSIDAKAVDGPSAVGLPTDPQRLADLVRPGDLAALAAALVRGARRRPRPGGPCGVSTLDRRRPISPRCRARCRNTDGEIRSPVGRSDVGAPAVGGCGARFLSWWLTAGRRRCRGQP